MIPPIPAIPTAPDGARSAGPVSLRYEDVQQEGRLTLVGLPHALGELGWPSFMAHPHGPALRDQGIVPILSRMMLAVGEGPVSAIRPLQGEACWHRAAVLGPDGAPARRQRMMWVDLYARSGWTLGPVDPDAPRILAGRVYAEHTYTRLFADPSARRVTALDDWSPAQTWPERRPDEVAPPVEGAPSHRVPFSFGVLHTDPNNHVNSLVYPRIFEEAALALRGRTDAARRMEVVWRKPFFAGETTTVHQWLGPDDTVHGAFLDEGGRARARMSLGW